MDFGFSGILEVLEELIRKKMFSKEEKLITRIFFIVIFIILCLFLILITLIMGIYSLNNKPILGIVYLLVSIGVLIYMIITFISKNKT